MNNPGTYKPFLDRADYKQIGEIVEPGSRVLDLGCGSGELLAWLINGKKIHGRGVEIDENNIISCINKGISVIQANIDEGLADFLDQTFDYVILSQTLQVVRRPDYVIREMLRVGKKGIVSLPNFGYWLLRLHVMLSGKMPKGRLVPYEWYDTPNIHLGSLLDFYDLCQKENISIAKIITFNNSRTISSILGKKLSNLYADEAIFVISKKP